MRSCKLSVTTVERRCLPGMWQTLPLHQLSLWLRHPLRHCGGELCDIGAAPSPAPCSSLN